MFYTSPGYPFTIALDGIYRVYVPNADMMYQAEDIAWDILKKALPEKDDTFDKAEIAETVEIDDAFLAKGYNVKLKVKFVIDVVTEDIEDAYYEAVEEVEGIELPDGVTLVETEQTDLAQTGERILVAHGDNV